ncbi:MAG TPA: beta-mannosidase, partial [Alphaproteobacteria bacterium]|nr:beta-mannosidase [Alphaproteobacteria bacterium]
MLRPHRGQHATGVLPVRHRDPVSMEGIKMTEVSLNGSWQLHDDGLAFRPTDAARVVAETDGWIDQPVPGDIHQGLVAAGRIAPPLLGLNSFDCVWTEQRSWWFRRTFASDPGWAEADIVELEMHGLDANAHIYLNGVHIGHHPTAFRPFVLDVKPWLQEGAPSRLGENVLLVRLTAGVEEVTEADTYHCSGVRASTEAGNGRPERGDPRRIFVRKPQYSFGWDWSPRLATTAIGGNVTLRPLKTACVREVSLTPTIVGDSVLVNATVTVDQFHYFRTLEGRVSLRLTDADGDEHQAQTTALLRSGYAYVDLALPIDHARLWWPNGLGEQHQYLVTVELTVGEMLISSQEFLWGLRFIELASVDDFAFIVNGCKVFAKGANWIPADTLYARVSGETYDSRVREARDANFNMLRVWGGGLYEADGFFEACDRYGILVWHDFMFACAPYPDDLPGFRADVEREADYQT